MNQEDKIKVMLADDHQLFREGIKRIINLEPDMEVIAEYSDGLGVLNNYEGVQPDVILMDINMPNMNGVDATRGVKELYPESRIMILSIHDDEAYVFETIQAGATGYLLKDMEAETLIEAIRDVAKGRSYIHSQITGKLIDEYRRLSKKERANGFNIFRDKVIDWSTILTNREYEVIQLVAQGKSNRAIGEVLYISEKTVKNHVSSILQKLDVEDRTQAVVTAVKNGWISLR